MKTALAFILVLLSAQIGTAGDREAAIGRLLLNVDEFVKQTNKTALDIGRLRESILETSGNDVNFFGLQLVGDSLSSLSTLFSCEKQAVFLYVMITDEELKKVAAQYLLGSLKISKESTENTLKQFWLGYSALKKKSAIHLADKAKAQIDEAQKLVEKLIEFYTSEYQGIK